MKDDNLRIIRGKNGQGWAYVRGNTYPVEGPGDGTWFPTPEAAKEHAIKTGDARAVRRGES